MIKENVSNKTPRDLTEIRKKLLKPLTSKTKIKQTNKQTVNTKLKARFQFIWLLLRVNL